MKTETKPEMEKKTMTTKLGELEIQLNYVCYDGDILLKLSKVWDAFFELKRSVISCDKDAEAFVAENDRLKKESYPKTFLLWTHLQDYWSFDNVDCVWVNDEPVAFQEEKTTNELFNYWKENEQ